MIIIALLILAIFAHGIQREAGYLRLPTLIATLVLLWFGPQLIELGRDQTVPTSGLNRLTVVIALSLIVFWIGWYSTPVKARAYLPINTSRLIPATIILTALSIGINVLLESYRPQMAGVQQWSGPITIIAFFAQIRDIALAVTILLFLRYQSKITLILLIANLLISLPVAFTLLRRAEMLGLGAAIICAFWFAYRKRISWLILIPGILLFGTVVYVVGPLRGAAKAIELATGTRPFLFDPALWQNIDVSMAFESTATQAHDLRNALYLIDYYAETYMYKFGATIWNGLVHQYIPGQIFGKAFKESLFFARGSAYDDILVVYGFRYSDGTTSTGFGSAFADFSYFGVIYFYFFAAVMKRMFVRAEAGDFWSQVSYMCFLPLVLVSMTHGHDKFFVSAPYLIIVIWGIRSIAKHRIGFGSARLRPRASKFWGKS